MFIDDSALTGCFAVALIVAAFVGWAVIEAVLWVASNLSISWG